MSPDGHAAAARTLSPRRRLARAVLSLLALGLLAHAAAAQQSTEDMVKEMKKHIDELTQRVSELTKRTMTLEEQLAAARAGQPGAEDEFYIPRLATEFEQSGMASSLGNIYTKPFLGNLGDRTYLGGYISTEARFPSGSGNNPAFDMLFVPFIYSDVTDRVKVAAEIEYDHGHEVEVEFAQLDYLFNRMANLRAGIQLLPLGKFNEVHDAPIQELTDRPLVNQLIIPTTLRDVGFGLWGDLSDSLSYNATVTNGFRGLDDAGNVAINLDEGLHDAAPHEDGIGEPFEQMNDSFAYTGRLAYKPVLGVELGGSALLDHYDESNDNRLNIYALDATVDGKAVSWLPDPIELLGEGAWENIERDDFAQASGVPDDMNGYYVQANYRFDPAWLAQWKQDGTVDEEAHFTFVTRYDRVHLDTYDRRRTTLGINFRPNAYDTVFKLDYQFNSDSGTLEGENDNNALLFSIATYF